MPSRTRIALDLIDLPPSDRSISPNKLVKLGAELRAAVDAAVPIKVQLQPCGERYLLVTGRDRFLAAKAEGAADIAVLVKGKRRGR